MSSLKALDIGTLLRKLQACEQRNNRKLVRKHVQRTPYKAGDQTYQINQLKNNSKTIISLK